MPADQCDTNMRTSNKKNKVGLSPPITKHEGTAVFPGFSLTQQHVRRLSPRWLSSRRSTHSVQTSCSVQSSARSQAPRISAAVAAVCAERRRAGSSKQGAQQRNPGSVWSGRATMHERCCRGQRQQCSTKSGKRAAERAAYMFSSSNLPNPFTMGNFVEMQFCGAARFKRIRRTQGPEQH